MLKTRLLKWWKIILKTTNIIFCRSKIVTILVSGSYKTKQLCYEHIWKWVNECFIIQNQISKYKRCGNFSEYVDTLEWTACLVYKVTRFQSCRTIKSFGLFRWNIYLGNTSPTCVSVFLFNVIGDNLAFHWVQISLNCF